MPADRSSGSLIVVATRGERRERLYGPGAKLLGESTDYHVKMALLEMSENNR